MFENIIVKLYDAFGEQDFIKAEQWLTILIINNASFFRDKDDRERINEILGELGEIKLEFSDLEKSSRYGGVVEKQKSKKVETLKKLEKILLEVYDIMHKYQMRVFFSEADNRPQVVKRSGR